LAITGNPFAQRGREEYADLEHCLSAELSAVIINRTEMSSKLAKRLRIRPQDDGMKALTYPKPVALATRDAKGGDNKNNPLKQGLWKAEMNKWEAFPISDIRPNTNQENEIFPKQTDGKNVFTPPEGDVKIEQEEEGNNFFITGDNTGAYPEGAQEENKEHQKNIIKEVHSEESIDEEDHNQIQEAEKAVQDRNMFEEVEEVEDENIDYGKAKMDEFKKQAMGLLLNQSETEYETPLDLPGAYKVLKGIIKNPVIVHSKRPNKGYMKQTFATSRHAVAVQGDEQRFLEYSKLSKQSKIDQSKIKDSKGDDLKLPPILAIKDGESDYREPSLLEKLEGFAGQPPKKLTKKQEKVNAKVEALLEADRNRQKEESLLNGKDPSRIDPKKKLREKYGFSDSDDY